MIYSNPKGSMLIIIIVTITILSTLGAAILSITNTSLYNELYFNNFNKAYYLAESGIRYTKLTEPSEWYYDEETYFTIWEDGGILTKTDDSIRPDNPQQIDTQGFHIGITDCKIQSTGSVYENTLFEANRTFNIPNLRGLPFWKFDSLTDLIVLDSSGTNKGQVIGNLGMLVNDGKVGKTLNFNGIEYVKTLFRPYCELSDSSFSITFWASPENISSTKTCIVLGVIDDVDNNGIFSDKDRGFSVGISNKKWMWTYGNQRVVTNISIVNKKWQHVILLYDDLSKTITINYMNEQDCDSSELTESYGNLSDTLLPYETKHLFIGAENVNSIAENFFKGKIDEIEIKAYNTIPDIDTLKPVCP